MSQGGRFGKYGDLKRKEKIRDNRSVQPGKPGRPARPEQKRALTKREPDPKSG